MPEVAPESSDHADPCMQREEPATKEAGAEGNYAAKRRPERGKEKAITYKGVMNMGNSPLVSYTKISPNRTSPRNHAIDTITIHCVVGQLSAETICGCFDSPSVKASCNYGIGTDGRIALCVEEKDRSWCSSNKANDHRAITIECASDKTHPYAINDHVYASLVALCTDICQRNGIPELRWQADKSLIGQPDKQNMTVHRWFANKACPGDYIYSRLGQIADEVNARLGKKTTNHVSEKPESSSNRTEAINNLPQAPFTVQVLIDDLYYRSEPSMNGKVNGHTGKGSFTIIEVQNGWGKLKSGAGWIYLKNSAYCTVIAGGFEKAEKNPAFVPYLVRVDIPNLNVRKGPGTDTPTMGNCPRGIYTIVEEASGKGATKWGRLKSDMGWVSLDYAVRV